MASAVNFETTQAEKWRRIFEEARQRQSALAILHFYLVFSAT